MLNTMDSNDHNNQSTEVMQYDDQFPPLPTSNIVLNNNMNTSSNKPSFQSSVISQTLVVPLNECRFSSNASQAGQKKVCYSVTQKCSVSIELTYTNKDLTVFITGLPNEVANAKKLLAKELQTQSQSQHKVPKECHRFILGKNGQNLREIETETSTNITVPRHNENNDIFFINGTREGIEKAKFLIDQIVIERSRLATERITIPKRYYPFIYGANNTKLAHIREKTNARINIPPPNVESDEIIISGEKDGVYQALEIIKNIYEDAKKNSSLLNLPIDKAQHRYVYGTRGSGINEIFQKTGVSVEMPSQDSDDDNIVLFGPSESLPTALSLVIEKGESMLAVNIEAPQWLHKFIIGKNGSNLNKLLEKYEGVSINSRNESDSIFVEGPKLDVLEVQKDLENQISELKRTMAFVDLQIDPRFHRHIIGRNGTNIQRLQEEYKVQIRMPNANSNINSSEIKIEGDPEGVKRAKEEIESMQLKLENEKTKDLTVHHKYHSYLIGAQGSKIKELRNAYSDVVIMFPDSSSRSDTVQIRGPKQQVEQVSKKLEKLVQEIIENNFTKEVKIYKQYHKNIIGKGGANIKKIREETNVRIDFPDERNDLDVITIIGKKAQVEEAARKIEAIQDELISIKEDSITIPRALHNSLIGTRGKFIKCIQEECGGVQIQIPSAEQKTDVIQIRGPEADVEKAKLRLKELAEKKQLLSHQETVDVKMEFHKFLIGRKGANLAEFKKRYQVMLIFPDSEDSNKDTITIVGAKEEVVKAKKDLEETAKTLENEVERKITVDPKWHKHFFKRRQLAMEEISRDFGGVKMYFPKLDATENVEEVRVVGPKGCIEGAIARIKSIIEDLEAQTTISVFIEQKHHRNLLTRNMNEIKSIQNDFDVAIKFPSRDLVKNSQDNNNVQNGSTDDNDSIAESDETNPVNLVAISGRRDNCSLAKYALLNLVPITEEVELENDFHRNLIGQKGQGINQFSNKYNVIVNIPQANKNIDNISIKGPRKNIDEAKEGLLELIKQWEEEKRDRLARNFEVEVSVPTVFHRNIIGQRGVNIDKFRNKFNVNIQMPDQNSGSEIITIRGYEEDANKAKDEICSMIKKLEAQVREELHVPSKVHPLLIGTRGFNLRKLREQYKVEIVFPNKNAESDRADIVEVIGDQENVDAACDHLVARANELLEELEERNQTHSLSMGLKPLQNNTNNNNKSSTSNNNGTGGFLIAGAPWQQRVPDAKSNEEFPSMKLDGSGDKTSNSNSDSTNKSFEQACLINGHFN